MTVTSGFFDSLNGDRKYNAGQISSLFKGVFADGVFLHIGTSFIVTIGSGMEVIVGKGRGWFNNTWIDNDALLPLSVDPAEAVLSRIDTVVLDIDASVGARTNTIKVLKGTPGSVPVAPSLREDINGIQIAICNILIPPNVTQIEATKLTNLVGTDWCPYISGLFESLTLDGITAILQAEFNAWKVIFEDDTADWFATVQGLLTGDPAVQLAIQMDALQTQVDNLSLSTSGTAAPSGGSDGDLYFRYI